jgi:hypothetical protein
VSAPASENIDRLIEGAPPWQRDLMGKLRAAINASDESLTEDWKWGTAVWVSRGNVCALAPFKDHVKVNFLKGASLADPHHLFNGGLEAKLSRSVDFAEGDPVDMPALQELVQAAVALNSAKR